MADLTPALTPAQEAVDKVLVDARAWLMPPGRWCQGYTALNCYGRHCAAGDDEARQWSIDGALWKVARCVPDAVLAGKCVRAFLRLPIEDPTTLWMWNDNPGLKVEAVRRTLWLAREHVPLIVQGRELSVTRAIHAPVPVPMTADAAR